MDLPPELRWSFFLYDLLWIVPLVASVTTGAVVLVLRRLLPAPLVVLTSFGMTITLLGLGTFGTWRSGLAVMEAIGAAGDVSVDLIFEGWRRSFWPLASTGTVSVCLLLLSVYDARVHLPKAPS